MSPCGGVVTIIQTPPQWDKHAHAAEFCETERDSDTDAATHGGRGSEFPLLQTLLEQMCLDINRNADCISKTEDALIQPAYPEHLLNAQITMLHILEEFIYHLKRWNHHH